MSESERGIRRPPIKQAHVPGTSLPQTVSLLPEAVGCLTALRRNGQIRLNRSGSENQRAAVSRLPKNARLDSCLREIPTMFGGSREGRIDRSRSGEEYRRREC